MSNFEFIGGTCLLMIVFTACVIVAARLAK